MLRWRLGHLGLFLFCASAIGLALHLQYNEFLTPCPMCILQRICIMICGVLALCAAAFPLQGKSWFWPALITLVAVIGAGISMRHLQIQFLLDPGSLPSCGAGLEYMLQSQPALKVLASVLAGSGECAKVDTFLGMPLSFIGLAGFIFMIEITWITRWLQGKKQ